MLTKYQLVTPVTNPYTQDSEKIVEEGVKRLQEPKDQFLDSVF